MSKNTKVSDFQKAVMDYLINYVEDIEHDVIQETDNTTKEALKEIKQTSPRGKGVTGKQKRDGPYWKGWRRQTGKAILKNHKYTIKIHNATNYQLTHLLEIGHATCDGGYTGKYPHIRPLEEKYSKIYEQKITTVIRRRSKK